VSVTSTGNFASTVSFDVTAVAQAHSVISSSTVRSLGATVASGPVTLTAADGSAVEIDTGSGSLSDVVAGINSSSAGVTAAAIRTGANQYRLQVTSAQTGAASEFSIDGLDGFDGLNVLSQGADAEVTIGSDPFTAYTATSSSNTFTDLVPGLSFTVSKQEYGVTLSSAVDGSNVATDVQKLVDAANSVLSSISAATAYSPTAKSGGALVGDSTARSLQQGILTLVGGARAPGVTLTRDGKIAFDAAVFKAAYKKNPDAVAAKFGAGTSFTPQNGTTGTVGFSSAGSATRAGTYAVTVDSVATREQWQLDAGSITEGSVVSLTRGSQSVKYTVAATDTLDDIVGELNSRSSAAGFGVSAEVSGETILATSDNAGSGPAFTLSVDDADQTQVTAGADVQGTIDGLAAVGAGNTLTLRDTGSRAVGLSVNVDLTQDDVDASGGVVGDVTYQPGLAQKLAQLVDSQITTATGSLATAKASRDTAVKSFQDQIDAWDARLASYRATLQTQFTAMETSIAKLKSQSSFLTSNSTASTSSTSSSSSSSG
jgi:flagellar hook-associated protein 2